MADRVTDEQLDYLSQSLTDQDVLWVGGDQISVASLVAEVRAVRAERDELQILVKQIHAACPNYPFKY